MATLVFPWIGKRHGCCAKGGNHAAQQKRLSHTYDDKPPTWASADQHDGTSPSRTQQTWTDLGVGEKN
jgi:hypothetical protein